MSWLVFQADAKYNPDCALQSNDEVMHFKVWEKHTARRGSQR